MADAPARSPLQLPQSWDSVAEGYAEHLKAWTTFAEEGLRLVAAAPTDHLLDVGAGPGTLAFMAAPRVARVTAIDFSPQMIAALERRKQHEGVENIEARVMDAQALQFENASFEQAFSLFAFMFFPDRAKAFTELKRVLKPGGRLLVATWAPIDRRPIMKVGFDALAEVLPDMPKPSKGDLQSTAECEDEFRAAGFVDVSARLVHDNIPIQSVDHYLALMVKTAAPFAALRKRLGETEWEATMGRFRTAIEARLPVLPTTLGAEAVLTLGTAP
jgi:ubiquinone/menaquinone biosynthesis C-methylase UbiE